MSLKTIRLELARSHEFPAGSSRHGYVLKAPLTRDGHLDAGAWKKQKQLCSVHRFWGGDEERGALVRTGGHAVGGKGRWAFSYVPEREEDDEPIFRLEDHLFKTGEYITITEHDGVARTFRVASVD
jgi:hypothetical protein